MYITQSINCWFFKYKIMADDKSRQDGRDDSKIDANDSSEVQYAAKAFGVTPEQIREAIKAVGNSRENVKHYLAEK